MDENLTEVRYQLFSLKFTNLKDNTLRSKDITFNVINYISNKLLKDNQGHLIDKHEGRQKNSRRELFMNRAVILVKDQRIRCSMALLRSGRLPLIKPREQFKLIPINESITGSIAEETHFFIDYSKNSVIICCEYNHSGPRISDIEYYFRNVAQKVLKQSRATQIDAFLDAPIAETIENLQNVLNLEIKIAPLDLNRLQLDVQNKYFSGMRNLSTIMEPKYLRVEAYFQSPGSNSKALNVKANNMIRDLLAKIKGNNIDIDAFKAFTFKFEDKEGKEEVFNLLSGKKEIVLNVDLDKVKSSSKWYSLIKDDLDTFVNQL